MNHRKLGLIAGVFLFLSYSILSAQSVLPHIISDTTASNYINSRAPLVSSPYLELPIGNIQPNGWLRDQLERMAKGMTGNLDEIYPQVVGVRNGWLGGDGDGWERGPYWIDGLLPLAYILEDEDLKKKANKWVEWTINNQTKEGYIGPIPFEEPPAYETGLQRGQRRDWWPKMVMLKILQQYYNATQDERVLSTLSRYFKYQLENLPERPLDADTFWANRRGGDNLQVVHWLYNVTGESFLLELAKILEAQTFPWTSVFLNNSNHDEVPPFGFYFKMKRYPFDTAEIKLTSVADIGTIHTVNLAQGLKQPALLYQSSKDIRHLTAIKKALKDLKKYHGQVQGMYGGDEPLHGANPIQGIEFCSISEKMFSLETILRITGDLEIADLLERIAYNALPAQAADDFSSRQYFQAANQVQLSEYSGLSFENNNHKGTDFVFGTLTGYPCCTANMHQSWPKFVQNLFYATADRGVAALQYAPSTVQMKVADNQLVTIKETTGFPFEETITFRFSMIKEASFPFHLRIPNWTTKPSIKINGRTIDFKHDSQLAIIDRVWKDGDQLELQLPMKIKYSNWYEYSAAIERGPLVYALKIEHTEKRKNRKDGYREFVEVFPKENWNFGFLQKTLENLPRSVKVIEKEWSGKYPWNLENTPIELKMKGIQIPEWQAVNGVPFLPAFWGRYNQYNEENVREITLVPYGCTTLRIAQFPVYNVP